MGNRARGLSTKEEIVKALRSNRTRIQALGVKRLGLFCTFVRGEQMADSDVDILVEFEPGQKTFDHFILKEVEYISVAA